MSEENNTTEEVESETAEAATTAETKNEVAKHYYYELESDLLSKPRALTSLIMTTENCSCVIFCNSPSEADLVDVMLKKEDIATEKLIGRVPHSQVVQTIKEAQNGNVTAVVITDVAARDLDSIDVDYIVNYSVHEDPEIYLHRINGYEKCSRLSKVITFVNPADFGNFHYLKKCMEFEIEKGELPNDDKVAEVKFESMINRTLKDAESCDEVTKKMAAKILEREDKELIVATLLHKSLNQAPPTKRGGRSRDGGRSDYRDNRDKRGRDRDGRRSDYKERKQLPPTKKDIRFYIGHGSEEKMNEKAFTELVGKAEGDFPIENLKRFNSRKLYSFVDIDEDLVDSFTNLADSIEFNGSKMIWNKATLIPQPRDEDAKKASSDSDGEEVEVKEAPAVEVEASA